MTYKVEELLADLRLEIKRTDEEYLTYSQQIPAYRGREDFHGIADAAMDLREIVMERKTLSWVLRRLEDAVVPEPQTALDG